MNSSCPINVPYTQRRNPCFCFIIDIYYLLQDKMECPICFENSRHLFSLHPGTCNNKVCMKCLAIFERSKDDCWFCKHRCHNTVIIPVQSPAPIPNNPISVNQHQQKCCCFTLAFLFISTTMGFFIYLGVESVKTDIWNNN